MPSIAAEPAPLRQFGRAHYLFAGVVLAYLVTLSVMAAFGVVGFVLKGLVVPSVLLVAIAMRRFRKFVAEWAIFLAAMFFFDSCRGLIYRLITASNWPLYMNYVIEWEEALFGSPVLPHRVQSWLYSGTVGAFEIFLCVIYASHFLVFLLFGLLLWLIREKEFVAYTKAVVAVMVLGLLGYLLVPTVPPWMAADKYHTVPPILSITGLVYNARLPDAVTMFDINPVAAMPSMHMAFPCLITFIAWDCFRVRSLPVAIYTLLVGFAVVYLGQHYLVDAIAGLAVAAAGYFGVYKRLGTRSWLPRWSSGDTPPLSPMRLQLTVAGLLIAARVIVALMSIGVPLHAHESRDFVERELAGKSDMADYFRGVAAADDGDYSGAMAFFEQARATIPPQELGRLHVAIGDTAFKKGDFAKADQAFSRLRNMPKESAWYWIQAKLALGQVRAALPLVLRLSAQQPPDHPVHTLRSELERVLPTAVFGEASAGLQVLPRD